MAAINRFTILLGHCIGKTLLFRFPATGCSTWKNQSVGRNRKSDFISSYDTVVFFHNGSEHVSQYCWLKSCCIRINQEEQRIIGEDLCTQFYQWVNRFLNFPDFAFRSSAIRRRIHNDCIVVVAAADLTLFTQSSTSQRIGLSLRPEEAAFSFAH